MLIVSLSTRSGATFRRNSPGGRGYLINGRRGGRAVRGDGGATLAPKRRRARGSHALSPRVDAGVRKERRGLASAQTRLFGGSSAAIQIQQLVEVNHIQKGDRF